MIDEPHDHAARASRHRRDANQAAIVLADCRHAGRCRLTASQHREVFAAMAEMIRGGKTPDVVTVGELVGDLGYLIELGNNTPGAGNIQAYAEIVAERAGNSPRAGRRTRDSLSDRRRYRAGVKAAHRRNEGAWRGRPFPLMRWRRR